MNKLQRWSVSKRQQCTKYSKKITEFSSENESVKQFCYSSLEGPTSSFQLSQSLPVLSLEVPMSSLSFSSSLSSHSHQYSSVWQHSSMVFSLLLVVDAPSILLLDVLSGWGLYSFDAFPDTSDSNEQELYDLRSLSSNFTTMFNLFLLLNDLCIVLSKFAGIRLGLVFLAGHHFCPLGGCLGSG